jgi:hypothetical protein
VQVRVVREAYYGKAKRRADDGVGELSVPGIWLLSWTFVENKGPNWLRFVILFWLRPGHPAVRGRTIFGFQTRHGPWTTHGHETGRGSSKQYAVVKERSGASLTAPANRIHEARIEGLGEPVAAHLRRSAEGSPYAM